jgi:hypothetical protein
LIYKLGGGREEDAKQLFTSPHLLKKELTNAAEKVKSVLAKVGRPLVKLGLFFFNLGFQRHH